jgi:triacylglycerol esterase/lipase EstA (alpha/beta hydrolase family)
VRVRVPLALSSAGPNRRLVLAAVGLIVLALVIGALALRQNRASETTTDQGALGTVILVPGYGGGTAALEELALTLQAAGRQTAVLRLAGDGTGDLRVEAERLDMAVNDALAEGAPSVDVIG